MEENKCTLCPRSCKVDRANGQKGYCGADKNIKVARASLHMWEEPCISGTNGSGTVFFSGCPLKCIYCQNKKIADGSKGRVLTTGGLSRLFLLMQLKGASNINLVTPTHFAPQIAQAIEQAKKDGLTLPIVYNTSGYEKTETLKYIDGLVDIYLPDLKYKSVGLSSKYSNAPDYFETAAAAVSEMVRQTGKPVFDDSGLMRKGTIVRHLVLPSHTKDSKDIISYLYNTYKNDIYVSIMSQYTPLANSLQFPNLSRRVTKREYDKVVDYAISLGVENAFIQEGKAAEESFIPDFDDGGFLDELQELYF